MTVPCPRCGARDTRPSTREYFLDYLWRVFARYPFRCRVCRTRFRRPYPKPRMMEVTGIER